MKRWKRYTGRALLSALIPVLTSSPALAQGKPAGRTAACKTPQLSAAEDRKEADTIDGGLGHHAITIAIQNRSSSSCALSGVPALTLSDSSNRSVPVKVCSNCGDYLFEPQPVREIILQPRESAYIVLGYQINDDNGRLRCTEDKQSLTVAMRLPGQSEPLKISIITSRMCGALNITPFLAKPPVEGSLLRRTP